MKREIKFRGKRKDNGEWVYGGYIDENSIAVSIADDSCNYYSIDDISVDPNTIGQFTGLKDKNEKEIYEGDILDTSEGLGIVTWTDFDGGYDIIFEDGCNVGIWEYAPGNVFVIGNIYENPELL